jgi:YesN/AraC family two-component response regulator
MLKLNLEMFLITLVREYSTPASLSAPKMSSDNKLSDISSYIAEHYTEKILLDNICFLFGTNKTTLCQSFRREYGITILSYIDQLKLKDAKKMLRKPRLSVTEISEQLGFASIHYFCRYFKKHTGISPKEYQAQSRKEG